MEMTAANFYPGQIIQHKLFHYRGVIYDVDANYCGTEEWYEEVAQSRPPRDEPWYHVLVDGEQSTTYVAQQNLAPGGQQEPIVHPLVPKFFSSFQNGCYRPVTHIN